MSTQNDRIWSACLDGELTATEANEFDRSLSPEERDRLAGEMEFEKALSDKLASDAECPDALWRRIEMRTTNSDRPMFGGRFMRWTVGGAAAAAALLIVFALLNVLGQHISEAAFLRVAEASVDQLAARSAPNTDDAEAAAAYLRAHGFEVSFTSLENLSDGHHAIELLGVREVDFRDERVAEMLFNCCGYPVKVALAPIGSMAARVMQANSGEGEVQMVGAVDGYMAAVVGRHYAPGLLPALRSRLQKA
jgi:hypothetical protein